MKGAKDVFKSDGTPPGEDGSADMKYVLQVASDIGSSIDDYVLVITKSTVPVGSSHKVRKAISVLPIVPKPCAFM